MRKINIEDKTKKSAASVLSAILLVLTILIIVPLITNFQIPILMALALSVVLSISIAIAYFAEDIIDDYFGTKSFGQLGEIVIVIILSAIILSVLVDMILVAPFSVKLTLLIVTLIVERVSKPIAKIFKL